MEECKKSYYAIIPANVRYDKTLTPSAKLLYGEITALCNEKGYCWSTNEYFASLYEVSKKTISTWINQLKEKKYITVEMIYKEGTKEILYRHIRMAVHPMEENFYTYTQKSAYLIEENFITPMEEKVKDNNTSFNNTINKKKETVYNILNNYTDNEDLKNALNDFIEMRKTIKSPVTERAMKILLNKLNELAKTDEIKIKVLDQSILNNWKGVFPLKEEIKPKQESKRTGVPPCESVLGERSKDWM